MAKITEHPKIDLVLRFEVSYSEAAALDALAGYGDDAFIKAFYENLGKAYMEKHEAGLRSFLKSVREFIPGAISRTRDAEKVFSGRYELVAKGSQ